ncbi:MAG: beta-lactamase family protein [Bacteroidetes bacterium]|nr:beta-lactamase family protein [Bacteroidota bacterium]
MRIYFRIFALLLIANTALAQGNFINDSLDKYIQREMKRWNLPGMAIAIVKDGKVIFVKGYGYSDKIKKTPVNENTVFQIASCSKAFTGTSLALLEHYGKLRLDDKVKKYLPYFKMNEEWLTQQITIRDVLSHRIGFSTFQSDFVNFNSSRSRKELIENMATILPKHGLREAYGYCNMGFVSAGEIIPAVCDTSWDDYLKYHYFIPLEMKHTSSLQKDFFASANASKAYSMVDTSIVEVEAMKLDNLGPAASISSTVNDMSKWIMMQLAGGKYNGKQVVPTVVIRNSRISNIIVGDGEGNGNNFETYGLGWFLKDEGGKKVVLHAGGVNGFLSNTVLIPEENMGFVVLTNSDAQYFYEALTKVLIRDITKQSFFDYSKQYYAYFADKTAREQAKVNQIRNTAASYKAQPADYKKLEGSYYNKQYGKITVVAKDKYAEIDFEFHPMYKAKVRFLSPTSLIIEYKDPTLGVQEIKCDEKTIEIKVNSSLDMDPYLFTKK